MKWFEFSRAHLRRAGIVALLTVSLALLAACGGGSDSDDDAAIDATVSPAGPTFTPVIEPEPTQTAEPVETATAGATSTPEPTATVTASPTPVPPTATPTIVPSPTATPLPTVESPFGESLSVVDVVPNFTLTYTARFEGGDGEDGDVDLLIEQANPEFYHLRVASSGQQTEAWRLENVVYVLGPGGAVVELPGLVDQNLYAPSSFLFLVPDLQAIGMATVLDEDADVEGRGATHYELDPAAVGMFSPTGQAAGEDVEGTFDVWVDNELDIVTRISTDVEWTAGGMRQSMQMEFLISNINSTPEIQPPM